MATLADIRKQYPQYSDMSDQQLADAMYRKHYSDMPRDAFNAKIGLKTGPARGESRPLMSEITGLMANFNRGLAVGDELTAAGNTVVNATRDAVSGKQGPGWGDRFKTELGRQRGFEDDFIARRPNAGNLAKGTGNAVTVAVPTAPALQGGRLLNMARGATSAGLSAAAYGLADRGTPQERLAAAASAGTNPLVLGLGAAGGALAPALPQVAKPKPRTNADVLKEVGVTTSLPQRMGGAVKQGEDLAMRAPILGPAISGARNRQVEQLNRAVGLKALEPVGMDLPANIKPGFEMVEHVDDALGSVYDQAAKLVPSARVDQPFLDDLASISERKADLATPTADQFERIVDQRLQRLGRPDANGALVKQIHSELGKLQREAARKGEDTLSGMIGDTRRALMGIVGRANPEAGALINQADQGWQVYSIMNDAAAKASNRGGVFLPGQLNTEVRAAGRGLGSNMVGKGKAPLQELSTAAAQTIPDQFGNPGTANAIGLGGLIVGAPTNPVGTAGAVAGLGAAATPYFLMGRKVIERLPENASTAELAGAVDDLGALAKVDPAVAELRAQVAARLAAALGVTGAAASAQPAQ
jgi:hypothetical protein